MKVDFLLIGLILVVTCSLLVANVSAAINLNSSKSNIYRTLKATSFEELSKELSATAQQLKKDYPAEISAPLKIDCNGAVEPFSITCKITWEKKASETTSNSPTEKANTKSSKSNQTE